ncbi:MAG: ATPase [Sulfobacillus benefaciens]|uniref:ATPase n=1 Tax=Sulfobacillus benefaciens TaxID=453960 RepID=A0A2T2XIX2_9FIRM|nr:MAG: ATPase [Sulfobacillus benefaciens]
MIKVNRYFPVGGPVSEDDLIDRELFLEGLTRRLSDGQNILLAGPRRIGKTSLALEVLRRLHREGYDVALVDMFGITSVRELTEHLANALLENRTGVQRTVEKLRDMVRAAHTEVRVSVQGIELGLSFARRQGSEMDLLEEALAITDKLIRASNTRVILVFDEFQELSRVDVNLPKILRSHLQQKPHISCLFLGSKPTLLAQLFSQGNEAFFRYAVSLPVPEIPPDAWSDYLVRKFSERGISITPAEVGVLLKLTGGHPQDTMLVASEIYYALIEMESQVVSLTVLEIAYQRALESLMRAFEELWGSLSEHQGAQQLIKKVAHGERPYGQNASPARVGRILTYAMNRGILIKVGRGQYEFFEPMFRDYVMRL